LEKSWQRTDLYQATAWESRRPMSAKRRRSLGQGKGTLTLENGHPQGLGEGGFLLLAAMQSAQLALPLVEQTPKLVSLLSIETVDNYVMNK
jgi:hypothetical protein